MIFAKIFVFRKFWKIFVFSKVFVKTFVRQGQMLAALWKHLLFLQIFDLFSLEQKDLCDFCEKFREMEIFERFSRQFCENRRNLDKFSIFAKRGKDILVSNLDLCLWIIWRSFCFRDINLKLETEYYSKAAFRLWKTGNYWHLAILKI